MGTFVARCLVKANNYEGLEIMDVYNSPIVDISFDVDKESFGYFPGVKGFYSKHVKYDKYLDGFKYEDHGIKHLYESIMDVMKESFVNNFAGLP